MAFTIEPLNPPKRMKLKNDKELHIIDLFNISFLVFWWKTVSDSKKEKTGIKLIKNNLILPLLSKVNILTPINNFSYINYTLKKEQNK